MATGGWGGIRPDLLEQAAARGRQPRGRRSIDELVSADNAARLERDLQRQVEELLAELQRLGQIVRWHHVPDTRRTRSEQAGHLDLVVGIEDGLVVAVELKRPDGKGRISPEQADWLRCWGERATVATRVGEVIEFLRRSRERHRQRRAA